MARVQQPSMPETQNGNDPRLMEFLRDKVNTFVRWDLIRFFHDNPYTVNTAEAIAQYTGRDVRTVEAELLGLVEANVLRVKQSGSTTIFGYTTDASVRELVAQFLLACDDREFRKQAIHQVLNGMR